MTVSPEDDFTREKLDLAIKTMSERGVHLDDYLLYGVKHGLLPISWAHKLADSYALGCHHCRHRDDTLPQEMRLSEK